VKRGGFLLAEHELAIRGQTSSLCLFNYGQNDGVDMRVGIGTVKAPKFGPHGNFGPLFQKSLLSLKRILPKNEEDKCCRKTLDLHVCFCSYLLHDSSKEATKLAKKKVKSFHEVQS
jgi:hypothetical protein